MSGCIFFNRDETKEKPDDQWKSELVNGFYWDAFGNLLDEVLLPNYPHLHEIIKSEEGFYLKFYSFVELNKEDFNLAVKLIRSHIHALHEPTNSQHLAIAVWIEIAEPYVVLDERYDAQFAGDPLP